MCKAYLNYIQVYQQLLPELLHLAVNHYKCCEQDTFFYPECIDEGVHEAVCLHHGLC